MTFNVLLLTLPYIIILGVCIVTLYFSYKNHIALKKLQDKGELQEIEQKASTGIIILFVSIFVIFAVVGIYMTLKRYQLAGAAIKSGQGWVAAAALAPEIGSVLHGHRHW